MPTKIAHKRLQTFMCGASIGIVVVAAQMILNDSQVNSVKFLLTVLHRLYVCVSYGASLEQVCDN